MLCRHYLPRFAAALAAFALSGCLSEKVQDGVPVTGPDGALSHKTAEQSAVGVGDKAYWISRIVAGYKETTAEHVAKDLVSLPAWSSCNPPAPKDGTKTVFVPADMRKSPSSVYSISRADIAKRAGPFVQQWASDGSEPRADRVAAVDNLKVANVFVTESSAPVYLVLAGGGVLWNIQTAPGTRIEQIVLLITGTDMEGGVANVPSTIPVIAMPPELVARCNATYVFPIKQEHGLAREAKAGQTHAIEALGRINAARARFDGWSRASFGAKGIDSVIIPGRLLGAALVGPQPATLEGRLKYRGIAGATVRS